jgi:hypothetical protein
VEKVNWNGNWKIKFSKKIWITTQRKFTRNSQESQKGVPDILKYLFSSWDIMKVNWFIAPNLSNWILCLFHLLAHQVVSQFNRKLNHGKIVSITAITDNAVAIDVKRWTQIVTQLTDKPLHDWLTDWFSERCGIYSIASKKGKLWKGFHFSSKECYWNLGRIKRMNSQFSMI